MIDTTYLSTSEIEDLQAPDRLTNCELCNERFWESSLAPYKDYMACEVCIRLSEEQDKENEAYDNGASRRTIEILEILKGDKFSEARRLIIEGINK